jgi:hypothetical protein
VPLGLLRFTIPLIFSRPILRECLQEIDSSSNLRLLLHIRLGRDGWFQLHTRGMSLQDGGPSGGLQPLGVLCIEDELVELVRVMTLGTAGILLKTKILHDVLILTHLVFHLLPDLLLLLVFPCTVQQVLVLD